MDIPRSMEWQQRARAWLFDKDRKESILLFNDIVGSVF